MAVSETLFQPGCPWWDLRVAWGAPNVKWCEATLCAWVNEPANAWSNLAYLAVALGCGWRGYAIRSRAMVRFAGTIGFVGVCSFIFHATNTFGTQLLDFVGMYVLAFLLLALNLHRVGLLRREQVARVHVGLTVGCTLLIPGMRQVHIPYQLVVLVAVLLIVATEIVIARRMGARGGYRDFQWAVGLLAMAAACLMVDGMRVGCDPNNHWVQGHAAWHVLSALALLFAARHYARVEAA